MLLALLFSLAQPGTAVAASFFVTSTDPEGTGGVFEALSDAGANPGPDEIVFAIGNGTIMMTSQLLLADGLSLRAEGGVPTLDGSSASSTTRGVVLAGAGTSVRGIAIRNYPNVAVEVRAGGTVVEACFLSGSQFGVLVIAAAGDGEVLIGGDEAVDGNFIYGNTFGVSTEPGASGVTVSHNVVGIDESDVVVPNAVGVAMSGNNGEVENNVISGNTQFGLTIPGGGVRAVDNNIGLARDEMSAAPNGTGILVSGPAASLIGNVVSGNSGTGILIGSDGSELLVNRIGVHRTLPLAFPNGGDGVSIAGGTLNRIGGIGPGPGNVIGANGGHGIYIQGAASTGNSVRGNVIGGDFPNAGSGLRIESSGNGIGLVAGFDVPNTISGNGLNGVEIVGPGAFGNDLEYNVIEANQAAGIRIVDASDNRIVGDPSFGNTIRMNGGSGVEIVSDMEIADRNTIRRNEITDNDAFGIALFGMAHADIEPPTTELEASGVRGTALPQATVDLYADPDEEGEFAIATVSADGDGDWLSGGSLALWGGSNLNATQTDTNGNTSEFSVPLPIPPGRVNTELPPDDAVICLDLLSGDEVVPPVETDANGRATTIVETAGKSVVVRIEHSVESPTAAELRMGLPGQNGPVVLDLGDPQSPILAALGGLDFHEFTAGDHYLLISGANAPSGEIRSTFLCPEPAAFAQSMAVLLALGAVARRRD